MFLSAQQEPERAAEGMGGTYFFSNENGRKVGVCWLGFLSALQQL
jgi:hypothetical protein